MKKEFSLYLDLVRFGAALLVVLCHTQIRSLSSGPIPLSSHGHQAVIVFFVLSGYVISYVSDGKENTPIEYWSSRLSRFYSVAIPAILLAPLLDLAGAALTPHFYAGMSTSDWWWLRIVSSALFTNELWTLSIMSFSNVPYWSLCYEMWYYVLYATVAFARGRTRGVLLALTVLFLGPKIMLLAPVWGLGVVMHRWQRLQRLPVWGCWALFCGSIPAYLLFHHYRLSALGSEYLLALVGAAWHKWATYSRSFLTDYLLAMIIAANFVGFRGVAHYFSSSLMACERPIRWCASLTFSLYLLHQPLLLFFGALIHGDPSKPWFHLQVLAATLASVIAISLLTEQKRCHLRQAIRRQLLVLSGAGWLRQVRRWQLGGAPKV